MREIVIFGGTVEGRELVESLQNTELQLHVCVATEYGASLLPKGENIHVYSRKMNETEMEYFFSELTPDYCVDATHPYACEVTKNIVSVCKNKNISYIRIARKDLDGGKNTLKIENMKEAVTEEMGVHTKKKAEVIFVKNIEEAAEYLCDTAGNIFITTGSKELEKYTIIPDYQNRCIIRVLPTLSVMEKCRELGFEGRNLIGMQGPFTEEMNRCMLKQINAEWMVTKNSGAAGGYWEKCKAALCLGVNILVIGKPSECIEDTKSLEETVQFLKEKYVIGDSESAQISRSMTESDNRNHYTMFLVGMGPGNGKLLTREAIEVLNNADVLIGAKRVLEIWPQYREKPHFFSYRKEDIVKLLCEYTEYKNVAVCYSGDIGFYSGAKEIQELFKNSDKNLFLPIIREGRLQSEWNIYPVSGISSVIYFLNRIGVSWNDVEFVSCHGKKQDFTALLTEKKMICSLLGDKHAVSDISRQLLECKMEYIRMTVGECLSYQEEKIITGCPEDFLNREFDSLSVILLEHK